MSSDIVAYNQIRNSKVLPAVAGYYVKGVGLNKVRARILRDYPTPQDFRNKLQQVHDETNKYLSPLRRMTLRKYIKELDRMPYNEYQAFVARVTRMKLMSFIWPWIFLWFYPIAVMIKNGMIDGKTGKNLINQYVHFDKN